ncbi:DUF3846 domain-containing protein [Agromyces mariniharenae]|uniref:DUF3846 domain-containing protein n=1 Tax=Agromyces mariniharenae TaxID=2604423 RepID=A0A5S4UZN2_9MICO|nr:DUF3846 domain-containing protein [Agromyces mariniharenae]TYL51179.1 DUF3846 domain-containing protein [Agromyces mariniharenae]
MVNGIVIPIYDNEPITELQVEKLEDYQAVVGGWIEPVDIPALGVTIYVHEEGRLLNLPFNSRASFLWWYFVPEARQRAMLVGPALLVGLPNRSGESTNVPGWVVELLTRSGVWRVEVLTVGDPKWYSNQVTYDDYFEALVWAMVTLERWSAAEDVRIVPVSADEVTMEAEPPAA